LELTRKPQVQGTPRSYESSSAITQLVSPFATLATADVKADVSKKLLPFVSNRCLNEEDGDALTLPALSECNKSRLWRTRLGVPLGDAFGVVPCLGSSTRCEIGGVCGGVPTGVLRSPPPPPSEAVERVVPPPALPSELVDRRRAMLADVPAADVAG
jgi:hypothetical protein